MNFSDQGVQIVTILIGVGILVSIGLFVTLNAFFCCRVYIAGKNKGVKMERRAELTLHRDLTGAPPSSAGRFRNRTESTPLLS